MILIAYCITFSELLFDTEMYNQGLIESYGAEYHINASDDLLYKKMAWEIIRTDAERNLANKRIKAKEAEIHGFNQCLAHYEGEL